MSKIAHLDMANDFDHINQTIKGQAIVSVQYSPRPAEGIPERVGVLHIQIPEGAEDRKLHAWLALAGTPNNEWVAFQTTTEPEEDHDIVRTDKDNDFINTKQTIGENQIVTIIDGGANSTPTGSADFDGQVFFSYRNIGTPEAEGAIWVAKGSQWLPVATAGGAGDDDTIARTNKMNVFEEPQKIGSRENMATFTSGRRTRLDPMAAGTPDMMPFTAGDIIVRDLDDADSNHEIYMATVESDAESWIKIYDSKLDITTLDGELTLLDGRVDMISDKLDMEIVDLDNLAKTVGEIDSEVTSSLNDISLIGTKVDILDPRVRDNELKIAALETHFDTGGTVTDVKATVVEHAQKHIRSERDITRLKSDVDAAEVRLTALESLGDGGGGEVDLSNYYTKPQTDALVEPVKSVTDLIPPILPDNNDKYVVVKPDGSGFTYSTESVTEINDLISGMVIGIQTGDQLINSKCLGGDTDITDAHISQVMFCSSPVVFGEPPVDTIKTVTMGDIAPFTAIDLTTTQVREGCITRIVNKGEGTLRLTPPEGIKLFANSDIDTFDVTAHHAVSVFPAIHEDGSKKYIFTDACSVNDYPATQVFVDAIDTRVATMEETSGNTSSNVAELTNKVNALEAIDPLLKTGGSLTGQLIVKSGLDANVVIDCDTGKKNLIRGRKDGVDNWVIGNNSAHDNNLEFYSTFHNKGFEIRNDGVFVLGGEQAGKIYTAGNKPSAADLDLYTKMEIDGVTDAIDTRVTTLEAIDPLLKTGGTMTGQIIIDENGDALRIKGSASYVSGYNGSTRKWWFGKGSSASDNFTIHNDAHDTEINLMDNKVKFNKMIYENDGRVYSPANKPTAADLNLYTKTEVDAIETKADSAIGTSNANTTEINTIKETVETQSATLTTVQTTANEAKGATDELKSSMETVDADIVLIKASTAKIPTMEENITSAIGTSNANTTAIGTLEDSVETANSSITTLTTRVATTESSVSDMETDVGNLNTDMISVKGKVSELETALETANGTITALQTKVTELESKIDALSIWELGVL